MRQLRARAYRAVGTHQISQTVQLLPEHAALLPPARDLAVHEVEDQPRKGKPERGPQVVGVIGQQITRGGENGERSADPVHDSDQVG